MLYPIGTQSFEDVRTGNLVYVDKTDLIYQLSQKRQVFLSRPRRFGKSLTLSTLDAYFSGKKELFEGLKMEALEKDWKHYEVINISFNIGIFSERDGLQCSIDAFFGRIDKKYGSSYSTAVKPGDRLRDLILYLHQQSGEKVVVLVDEYDKPMTDCLDVPDQMEKNRLLLRDLYSAFKVSNDDLRFIMLTGVTKFAQVNIFSGMNQIEDISFNSAFETLCGITEHELHTIFAEPIAQLAQKYRYSIDDMHQRLRDWYDGYHFSNNLTGVYNPYSIINCFNEQALTNFWITSGGPEWLVRAIAHKDVDILELLQKDYRRAQLIATGTMENVLPMLFQTGYLTIKDYTFDDEGESLYTLKIPNGEVRRGFYHIVADNYFHQEQDYTDVLISTLNRCLRDKDLDTFFTELKSLFANLPYQLNDKRPYENYFQHSFGLIILLMTRYKPLLEHPISSGRIDVVFETDKYVYIFEFKVDGTVDEALRQIDEKGYTDPYLSSGKEILKIGAVFSSSTRTLDDWGPK